jgi:hypothetical protein
MLGIHLSGVAKGATRERLQLENWLFAYGPDFLLRLGLPNGWWCAVNLPRRDVFAEASSGDVDLLAGPLGLTIGEHDFALMLSDAQRARPQGPPDLLRAEALDRAGKEGLVQWPPDVRFTVAVEVKASFFDGQQWKATHVDEKQKILGSLRERRARGVNSATFLHLGVVAAVTDYDELDARIDLALDRFPVMPPDEFTGFGYVVRVMGAMTHDERLACGCEKGLWLAHPRTAALEHCEWHDSLRDRFARMPRPRYFRTFVHACPRCRHWSHAGSANVAGVSCSCDGGTPSSYWDAPTER